MAHKKGVGSSRNGRDSNPKRLGVKEYAGETVNAGAILVLFVFVIMMLGREESEPWALRSLFTKVVGGVAIFIIGYVVLRLLPTPALAAKGGAPPASFGTVGAFGDVLFKEYLFPFEAVSLLLLMAVIGAIVIARGRRAPQGDAGAAPEPPKEHSS